MERTNNAANNIEREHRKDTELQAVYQYLYKQPATATEVALSLGIYRPNLCRRKRTLEKAGRLRQLKRIICPITKHSAWQLTCNPDLFPTQQPTLWEGVK